VLGVLGWARAIGGSKRAISPVVSAVIITATLLTIIVVATALASSTLETHLQNLEFEQAKTMMMALGKVIAEVSLRPGAASSVQFNQRSGGMGVYQGEALTIRVYNGSELVLELVNATFVVKYRGGSMVSAAPMDLSGSSELIVEAPKPLGYVRVEVGNGAWIVLDYNRVRLLNNTSLGTVDLFLILLRPGTFGGAGIVTVKVQNKGARTWTCEGDSVVVKVGDKETSLPLGGLRTTRITEVVIEVSTM
jgi:hypothetical protein